MTFFQRIKNTFFVIIAEIIKEYVSCQTHQRILDQRLNVSNARKLSVLVNEFDFYLLNSHPLFGIVPVNPNTALVGGIHIMEPKPLPPNIQEFLDGAHHGAIVFAFGTVSMKRMEFLL